MPIYVRAAGPEVLPPQIYNYNALNALALARKAQSLPSTTTVPEQEESTVLLTDDSEGNVNGSRSSASDVDGAGATNTELSARNSEGPGDEARADATHETSTTEYRVYKRRFFGLFQLVLLNIIVSWDVSCCSVPGDLNFMLT